LPFAGALTEHRREGDGFTLSREDRREGSREVADGIASRERGQGGGFEEPAILWTGVGIVRVVE